MKKKKGKYKPTIVFPSLLANIASMSSKSTKDLDGTSPMSRMSCSSDIFPLLKLNTHMLYLITPANVIINDVLPHPGGPNNRYPLRYGMPEMQNIICH